MVEVTDGTQYFGSDVESDLIQIFQKNMKWTHKCCDFYPP